MYSNIFDKTEGIENKEIIYTEHSLWNLIVDALIKEKDVAAISLDMWIKPLIPIKFENNILYIKAPTENGKRMVINKFGKLINHILLRINNRFDRVEIITNESDIVQAAQPIQTIQDSFLTQNSPLNNSNPFKKDYTFNEFVVGRCNQFAYMTAKSVAEYPGTRHNPLFIFGGVGMGKTHLLHAIGNQMIMEFPSKKIVYITFEKFMNELLYSMGGSRAHNQDFREKYRKLDVLMVDDIQFIAGKERTQEEFFHTFEELYNENKQIIIASDRPPKDINPLEERLRSRFNWDVTVDIAPPDVETRTAILQRRAQNRCFNINQNVLEFIASKITTNIRELIGFFNKVVSYSMLMNKQPNSDLVMELLKDYVNESAEAVTIESIIDVVCSYFKVDKDEIKQRKRNKEVAEPRMVCMYLITELLPSVPLIRIGQEFNRDHTTVIHARDKIAEQVKQGGRMRVISEDIIKLLKNNV